MNLGFLLFSFSGRINRAQFWVGCAIASVSTTFLAMALIVMTLPAALSNPTASIATMSSVALSFVIPVLFCAYCSLALQAKRMHDRGRSAWVALLPAIPGAMLAFSNVFAIVNEQSPGEFLAAAMPWVMVIGLIQFLMFIDLGFFPSKPEANRHGPPPGGGLGGGRPSAPSAPIPGKTKSIPQPMPGMGSSMLGAESAIDRAIAAHERKPQSPQPAPRAALRPTPAPAAAPSTPMRPATGGSFGRKAAQ